ncbi:hypothetical protein LP420_00865 [Massilia sp. B-10]|nr:hypothetical protein LP420_00865 [Massilia sp. B-10]
MTVPATPLFAASVVPGWLSAIENCPATDLPNPFSGGSGRQHAAARRPVRKRPSAASGRPGWPRHAAL